MSIAKSFSEVSFCSNEWRPSCHAWSTFNDFRREGTFCDVVLKVKNASFPAHRLVLCVCSEYFRTLFLTETSNNEKREVEIFGVTPDIMASILEFAYTGQVIVTEHNVQELLLAADRFQVSYVKEKCASFMKRQLSSTNCITIYKYAESFSCEKLRQTSFDFMLLHFEDIVRNQKILQLPFEDFFGLVSNDRLNVRNEETVCEAIFGWIRGDRQFRIDYLSLLLGEVRLGLLQPDYLMRKVNANEMVIEKISECQEILNMAIRTVHKIPVSVDVSRTMQIQRPRLPYDLLVAVGGWCGNGSTNVIEAYDARAKTWVNMQGLSEDRCRAYHGVIFLDKCLYIIGGYDGVTYFDSVRKLDVVTNRWTEETSMFHRRCYVSVTKMDGKIYALGGMDGQYRLRTAEVYHPRSKIWKILPDMYEERSDASAASLDDRVYICGGFNGRECLFTAEFFDAASQAWTWITPMMTRRSGVSVVALNGLIYAVGGFDGVNRLHTAEAYCPNDNTWTPVAPMNKGRSNFGMDVLDKQIIAVGGFNGIQTTSDVEIYEPMQDTWLEANEMHVLRSALSCCVMDKLPYSMVRRLCEARERQDIESDKKDESELALVVVDVIEGDEESDSNLMSEV